MFWNQYPYINLNDLNLDYLLKAIGEMQNEVKNFVTLNAVKYADPIQWDITSQYEKNTIVIDPLTGTAYISVQSVPSGVALNRTNYWTPVFDLSRFITQGNENLTEHVEDAGVIYSTFALNVGDWVIWNGVLYKALVNMPIGTAYSVDGNIKRVTVEEYIKSILTAIANEVQARIDADAILQTNIDNEAITRGNADTALSNNIGDLTTLLTSDKTSTVNAINELYNDISTFSPEDTTYVNVKDYGAKGDGITDDTQAINDAIAAAGSYSVVFFPQGEYLTSGHTLTTATGFAGVGPQTVIKCTDNTHSVFEYDGIDLRLLQIRNLYITRSTTVTNSDSNANGITLKANCNGQGLLIENVSVHNQYNAFDLRALIAGSTLRDCLVIQAVGTGYYFNGIWYVYNCQAQNCNNGFLVSGQERSIAGFYFDGCTAYRTVSAGFTVDGSVNAVYDVMFRGCVAGSNRTGGYTFYGAGGNHTITSCYSEYAGYSNESKSDPNAIVNASAIYAQNQVGMIISDFYEFESAYSGIALVNCHQVKVSNCIARGNDYSGIYFDGCAKIDVTNCNFIGLNLADYGVVLTQVVGSSSEIVIDGMDIRDCINDVYVADPTAIVFRNYKGYSPTATTPTLTSDVDIYNTNVCDVQVVLSGATALTVKGVGVPVPNSVASFILKKGESCKVTHAGSAYWAWIPLN